MNKPKVEFFSEDVDGVEYLNVGFVFELPGEDEPVRCVLGAFSGEVANEAMVIIRALVEEAAGYMQDLYDGTITVAETKSMLEVVTPELILPDGS